MKDPTKDTPMTMTMALALELASGNPNNPRYLEAALFLVDNRKDMPRFVQIEIIGRGEQWNKVLRGSENRCYCGTQRVILPEYPRKGAFDPGAEITISDQSATYIRPKHGDKESACARVYIENGGLCIQASPFETPDLITSLAYGGLLGLLVSGFGMQKSVHVYSLSEIAAMMRKDRDKPLVFMHTEKVPMFRPTDVGVTLSGSFIGLQLDEGLEVFDPDKEPELRWHRYVPEEQRGRPDGGRLRCLAALFTFAW